MSTITKNGTSGTFREGSAWFPGYTTGNDAVIEVTQFDDHFYNFGFIGAPKLSSQGSYRAGAYISSLTLYALYDTTTAFITSISAGDVIKVSLEGGKFYIRRNGPVVYSFPSTHDMGGGVRVFPAINIITPGAAITPVLTGDLTALADDGQPTAGDVLVEFDKYGGRQGARMYQWTDGTWYFSSAYSGSSSDVESGLLDMRQAALTDNAWVEYVMDHGLTDSQFLLGLSTASSVNQLSQFQFCFYILSGSVFIYESGSQKFGPASYYDGDVLRINISAAGAVTYLVNGSVIYTSAATYATGRIAFLTYYAGEPSADVKIWRGGDWKKWVGGSSVATTNTTITKIDALSTSEGSAWYDGYLSGDGSIADIADGTADFFLGFSGEPRLAGYKGFRAGVFNNSGTANIHPVYNGAIIASVGTFNGGEEIKIKVASNVFTIEKNGTTIYTFPSDQNAVPGVRLVPRVAIIDTGKTLTPTLTGTYLVVPVIPYAFTPGTPAFGSGIPTMIAKWLHYRGTNLSQFSDGSWISTPGGGDSSINALGDRARPGLTADAWLEVVYSAVQHRIGLSTVDPVVNYTSFRYSWYFASGDTAFIYENGNLRTSVAAATGDLFRINVTAAGSVTYLKNGTLVYTSLLTYSTGNLWALVSGTDTTAATGLTL